MTLIITMIKTNTITTTIITIDNNKNNSKKH